MSQLAEIANALVTACRENRAEAELDTLYDPDAHSVEAFPMPGTESAVSAGLDAIRGKHQWWVANFDVHGGEVDGPYLHGDTMFSVIFEIDATNKQSGERTQMKEVALYHVQNGKITREEFFFQPPAA